MAYTGVSIVDYLKSIGQDSSYATRSALASKYGISNYSGTPEQNTQLLGILRNASGNNSNQNTTKKTENQNTTQNTTWSLTGWKTDGAGNWITQPQLVINGQTFVFTNPQDYIKKLQELKSMTGVGDPATVDNFISQFNNATTEFAKKTEETTNNTSSDTTNIDPNNIEIPEDIKNSDYYNALDEDGKKIVNYYYGVLNSNNAATAKKFSEALDLAKEQADPYWKEKINIIKDSLTRTIASTDADLISTEKTLNDRINAINEDLTYNKEQLSLDQQAELKTQADNLQKELDTTRETMANKGLSSSSIKTQAEESSKETYGDLVESTTRKYARENRNQEVTAARNLAIYQQQIADAQRKALEGKTTAARTLEEKLGTSEASSLLGNSNLLLGGISGTIGEDKGADILSRANALLLTK